MFLVAAVICTLCFFSLAPRASCLLLVFSVPSLVLIEPERREPVEFANFANLRLRQSGWPNRRERRRSRSDDSV